jgi:thioredoxin-related protein
MMKYLITFTFFAFLLSSQLFSQPAPAEGSEKASIHWYSIEEALALNAQEPKKIFVDIYTNWCGYCKKMDATTFAEAEAITYINQHFYAVKLNAETKKEITLANQTYVNPNPGGQRSSHQLAVALLDGKMSYPSYVFLNEKNEKLTVVKGYLKLEDFMTVLTYFGSNAYLSQDWGSYQTSKK